MQLDNSTNSAAKRVRGKMQEGDFYTESRDTGAEGAAISLRAQGPAHARLPRRPAWGGVSALP